MASTANGTQLKALWVISDMFALHAAILQLYEEGRRAKRCSGTSVPFSMSVALINYSMRN